MDVGYGTELTNLIGCRQLGCDKYSWSFGGSIPIKRHNDRETDWYIMVTW